MESRGFYVFLVVLTALVYAGTLVINAAAGGAFGKNPIFHNTTGEVSNFYYLEITPAGATFSIWGLIYLWQLAWVIYSLTTLCRSGAGIHIGVFPFFIVSCALNVSWLILWDRFLPQYALVVLISSAFSLYGVEYFACKRQDPDGAQCEESCCDRVAKTILLKNGISFYAGWGSLAMLLNAGIVLTYSVGLNQSIASTIVLALLMVLTTTWFFIDVTQLDRYLRYVFACYFPLIAGLVGSIAKNWDPVANNSILTACILAIVVALTLARIIIMIVRACRKPQSGSYNLFKSSGNDYSSPLKSEEKIPVL